jgi:glycosyltransferase involved in cell wall biosynthesis
MRVVGISLVADAIRLEFPILEALRSVLPLCDELIVNLGPSDDGTEELVRSLADPRLRLVRGEWNRALGGAMLAVETQRVLDGARGDWALYIQADEVLHEDGVAPLRAAMEAARHDRRVEGLLVEFLHFYGSPDWVGTGREWYRREVRVVRPGVGVRSYADAQGFRVGSRLRRIRARRSGATYYHYGWARPLEALRAKRIADQELYYGGAPRRPPIGERLPWRVGQRPYHGTHPAVMAGWIAARRARMTPGFGPGRWDAGQLRLALALGLERLTGWRPFEFRNYVEV